MANIFGHLKKKLAGNRKESTDSNFSTFGKREAERDSVSSNEKLNIASKDFADQMSLVKTDVAKRLPIFNCFKFSVQK